MARPKTKESFGGLHYDPEKTVYDNIAGELTRFLVGDNDDNSEELEKHRETCRKGNPFPLIEYQWPFMVVTDLKEQVFFRDIPIDRLRQAPKQLVDVITDPSIPCLRLDWWQMLLLSAFFDPTIGQIFVKGCTGAGKGASTSIAACLWYDVYEESRITLTSRDHTHARTNIFGEVSQWYSRMTNPLSGFLGKEGITETPRHYVRILNPDPSSSTAGEAFSGAHGKNTIYFFDESSSLPGSFVENAEKNARKIVAISNPRSRFGWFFDGFKPLGARINEIATCNGPMGVRLCVTIGGQDCINVRHKRLKNPSAPAGGIEIDGVYYSQGSRIPDEVFSSVQPLIQSQMDYNQFSGILTKGDPRLIECFAHGRFPAEDPEKQVILESYLKFHTDAYKPHDPPKATCFALDVARSLDGDSTVLAAGGLDGVAGLHTWKYDNTTYHVSNAIRIARDTYGIDLTKGANPVVVDMDGLGAGVGDQLASLGVWVIEFRGNATSEVDPRTYANLRCEGYATLGRRLNPDDRWRGEPWALPPDTEMLEDLCAPERIYGADGIRFHITPKNKPPDRPEIQSVKDKLGRSPDKGDSVVYLFHGVRVLHNLNEWFTYAARDLIVYPLPKAAMTSDKPAEEESNEPIPDILQRLTGDYQHLLDRQEKQTPPDWQTFYNDSTTDTSAKPTEESWVDRVKWDDD